MQNKIDRVPNLERAIAKYLHRGYRPVYQTKDSAQLVKPKQFSCLLALVTLCLGGFPLIVYLIYFASIQDKCVRLQVIPEAQWRQERDAKDTARRAFNKKRAIVMCAVGIVCVFTCLIIAIASSLSG